MDLMDLMDLMDFMDFMDFMDLMDGDEHYDKLGAQCLHLKLFCCSMKL
jgi:hypothetical protein